MPNIWTHKIFGQEALERVGLSSWINNESDKKWFNMGCQGPDFLFYHHFLPWKTDKTMNKLGSAMHTEQCGPTLLEFITRTSPSDRTASVYVLGFLLHHILDRHMHPYVFVRSGFKKWDHQRFEVLMDTHVVKRKLDLETWCTPVWPTIDVGPRFTEALLDTFEAIVTRHYPQFQGKVRREAWNEAIRDMVQAQRLFHDPHGWKRIITFNQIEPLMYKRRVAPHDVMNEARRPWPDPTGTGEMSTTSIWDMWDTAAVDAERALRAVLTYWQARENAAISTSAEAVPSVAEAEQLLKQAIGNHSYETGLPLEKNRPIIVEDPIW